MFPANPSVFTMPFISCDPGVPAGRMVRGANSLRASAAESSGAAVGVFRKLDDMLERRDDRWVEYKLRDAVEWDRK